MQFQYGDLASPATLAKLFKDALTHHQQGRLTEAEELYRQILTRDSRHADSLHLLGLILHQTNRSERAGELIRKAIKINGTNAVYHSNLAFILAGQGEFHEAKTLYKKALVLDPNNAEAHYKLGCLLQRQDKFDDAKEQYLQAVHLRHDYAEAHCNLSVVLDVQGETQNAIVHIQLALALQPDLAEAHYNLGNFLKKEGNVQEAIAHYKAAILIKDDYISAISNLALLLHKIGQTDEAIGYFNQALVLAPNNPQLHLNLGLTLCALDRLEEGGAHLERAVALNPKSAEAHYNYGFNLYSRDKLEEAVPHYEEALALNPDSAEAHNNLGVTLDARNLPDTAITHYQRALKISPSTPEARFNLAMSQLRSGDFANGWQNYESRWTSEKSPLVRRDFHQPMWCGEPLDGARILLHAEQGLGDTIQFLRYVPMVQRAGGSVVLEVQGRLKRLASELAEVAELIVVGDPLPTFEYHCPLLSLPLAFGTKLNSIPNQVPYLTPSEDARIAASALAWPSTGLKVGLVWSGKQTFLRDRYRYRSVSLSLFAPLFDHKNIRFFSLQHGESSAELNVFPEFITDLAPHVFDMADTAAHIERLDLVISVDTSVAHLAGALGIPTWTLLPYASDWRWLVEGSKSSWYPTMRLFRQSTPGDWNAVIRDISEALGGNLCK